MFDTEIKEPEFQTDQPLDDSNTAPFENESPVRHLATEAAAEICAQIDRLADAMKGFAARQTGSISATPQINIDAFNAAAIDAGIVENDPEQLPVTSLDDVVAGQDEILQQQMEQQRLFESRIHSDEVQARALERLHGELQDYKQNFVRQEMMPLLKDVIFCHDVIAKEADRIQADRGDSGAAKAIELIGQMLLDTLFKYDVEPFRGETDEYDRKSQQCVGTELTGDQQLDKHTAMHGLLGFRMEDKIIRREQVTVYRYEAVGGRR